MGRGSPPPAECAALPGRSSTTPGQASAPSRGASPPPPLPLDLRELCPQRLHLGFHAAGGRAVGSLDDMAFGRKYHDRPARQRQAGAEVHTPRG